MQPPTTGPPRTAFLPSHLQHHRHKNDAYAKALVESYESLVIVTPAVKGCGGLVKTRSLVPRSGPRLELDEGNDNSPHQIKLICSVKSSLHAIRNDAKYHRSRLTTFSTQKHHAAQSKKKGRASSKRRMRNVGHAKVSPHPSTNADENPKRALRTLLLPGSAKPERPARISPKNERGATLGPITAHALRICFCQPYDGAGEQSRCPPVGRIEHGSQLSKVNRAQAPDDQSARCESEEKWEPAARVITTRGDGPSSTIEGRSRVSSHRVQAKPCRNK